MNREDYLIDDRANTKREKEATIDEEAKIETASTLEPEVCNHLDNKKDGTTRPCNTTILTKKEERTSTGGGSNPIKSPGIGSSEIPTSFSIQAKTSGERMDFAQEGANKSIGEEEIASSLTVEARASATATIALKKLDSSNFKQNVGSASTRKPQLSPLHKDVLCTASETTACTDITAPGYGDEKASHKDKVRTVNTVTNGSGESTCSATKTLRYEKVKQNDLESSLPESNQTHANGISNTQVTKAVSTNNSTENVRGNNDSIGEGAASATDGHDAMAAPTSNPNSKDSQPPKPMNNMSQSYPYPYPNLLPHAQAPPYYSFGGYFHHPAAATFPQSHTALPHPQNHHLEIQNQSSSQNSYHYGYNQHHPGQPMPFPQYPTPILSNPRPYSAIMKQIYKRSSHQKNDELHPSSSNQHSSPSHHHHHFYHQNYSYEMFYASNPDMNASGSTPLRSAPVAHVPRPEPEHGDDAQASASIVTPPPYKRQKYRYSMAPHHHQQSNGISPANSSQSSSSSSLHWSPKFSSSSPTSGPLLFQPNYASSARSSPIQSDLATYSSHMPPPPTMMMRNRSDGTSPTPPHLSHTGYSRKDKALGLLAQKLISVYEYQTQQLKANRNQQQHCSSKFSDPSGNADSATSSRTPKDQWNNKNNDTNSKNHQNDQLNSSKESQLVTTLSIDQTATQLGVERRRIYDIINILEALDVVSKKGKNVYWWHGLSDLQQTFCRMQREALELNGEFRMDGIQNGIISENEFIDCDECGSSGGRVAGSNTCNKNNKQVKAYSAVLKEGGQDGVGRKNNFGSLGTLSKKFLQLYLSGYDRLSLGEATERLLGAELCKTKIKKKSAVASEQENDGVGESIKSHRKRDEEVRGWKTKVRRLYDIANVLVSIGIINKAGNPSSSNSNSASNCRILGCDGKPVIMHKNNQYFCWKFAKNPKQIKESNVGVGAERQEEENATVVEGKTLEQVDSTCMIGLKNVKGEKSSEHESQVKPPCTRFQLSTESDTEKNIGKEEDIN